MSVEYCNVRSLHGQYFTLLENKIHRTPHPLTKEDVHRESEKNYLQMHP